MLLKYQTLWILSYGKLFKKRKNIKKIFGILRGYKRRIIDIFRLKNMILFMSLCGSHHLGQLLLRAIYAAFKKVIFDLEDNFS